MATHAEDRAPTRGTVPTRGIGRWGVALGAGLVAGVVGVLLMTLVMLVLRSTLGISPPFEMIPDRIAPALSVDRFLEIMADYGGYNGLKRFGIRSGLQGQFATGALLGLLYGAVVEHGRGRTSARESRFGISRRGVVFVIGAALVLWIGTLAFLWPTLDTNYRGLPPSRARVVTALGFLVAYASYGTTLILTYRFLTGRRAVVTTLASEARPTWPVLGRRALVAGGAATLLALASRRRLDRFEEEATFSYDGTRVRGEIAPITPNAQFYVVTKNVVDPRVGKGFWGLEVNGHVDRSRTYDFDDLTALPATTQETTLMCISNSIGDGLISNAVWKGVPMRDLLRTAGVKEGAVEIVLHGADGYTDTFAIEKALDPTTLVAYEMNGEAIPDRHGYPVRVVVPGLYGEKNVKWVTRIEVVDHEAKGFYERQGWGPDFVIPTRASVHAPNLKQPLPVGQTTTLTGLAFGGDRGVSRVELSFDDGRTWTEATITHPSNGLSWALWRYDWRPTRTGDYRLVVRAADGTGALQTAEGRGVVPHGATGYHRVSVRAA